MVRMIVAALALTAALPAAAEVRTATVDGQQITYSVAPLVASPGQAPVRALTRDDVLGMLRNAQPVTPQSGLATQLLEPGQDGAPRP